MLLESWGNFLSKYIVVMTAVVDMASTTLVQHLQNGLIAL